MLVSGVVYDLSLVQFPKICNQIREVPAIVIAHTFCASRDSRISYGWCLLIQGYFCAVQTMRRKQNLASTLGIQKENWG